MAISIIQSTNNSNGLSQTTVTISFSAVGSGNAIVGQVCWNYGSGTAITIVSIKDNLGADYTQVTNTTFQDTTNKAASVPFYLLNITSGPTDITVTFSASVTIASIEIDEVAGLPGGSTLLGNNMAFQASATALDSGNATPTTGALVYGTAVNTDTATPTCVAAGSFTRTQYQTGFYPCAAEWLAAANATPLAALFTAGSATAWLTGVIIIGASGGGDVLMAQACM